MRRFVDPLKIEGHAELSRNLQIATALLDAAGLCIFVVFAILDFQEGFAAIPKMINARYGWNLTLDDLTKYGQKILKAERDFNLLAGFTKQHDRLPDFFREKKLPPHNTAIIPSLIFQMSNWIRYIILTESGNMLKLTYNFCT